MSHTVKKKSIGSNGNDPGVIQKKLYNRRWEKMRALFLREHPLCVHFAKDGRVTTATEVDHIIPYRGNWELFWDQSQWQQLC